jgi:hypothetical protein
MNCPICGAPIEIKETWIEAFEYDFLSLSPGYKCFSVKCDECGFSDSSEVQENLEDRIKRIERQPECNPGMKLVSEYLERTLGKRPEVEDIQRMLGNLKAPKSL